MQVMIGWGKWVGASDWLAATVSIIPLFKPMFWVPWVSVILFSLLFWRPADDLKSTLELNAQLLKKKWI